MEVVLRRPIFNEDFGLVSPGTGSCRMPQVGGCYSLTPGGGDRPIMTGDGIFDDIWSFAKPLVQKFAPVAIEAAKPLVAGLAKKGVAAATKSLAERSQGTVWESLGEKASKVNLDSAIDSGTDLLSDKSKALIQSLLGSGIGPRSELGSGKRRVKKGAKRGIGMRGRGLTGKY